jgi:putative tryptophan/tyrosine transport system substrate-binding protein
MRRRAFIALLGAATVALPRAGMAQSPERVRRIGVLVNSRPEAAPYFEAFRPAMRDLGWVEGRNIAIDVRGSERYEELPELAAQLAIVKPDALVAFNPTALEAAARTTNAIPIVMVVVGDPVGFGYAASYARPGGNITGASAPNIDLSAKRIELLKEALPNAARIAVLRNALNPAHPRMAAEAQRAGAALGLTIGDVAVRSSDGLDSALAAIAQSRCDALVPLADGMLNAHRASILAFAAANRLPVVYAFRTWVTDGALMSYGMDYRDHWRRAATYVDKILKGANPADLAIEQPTTFELVVNLKTAKALGIVIPQSILLRADAVIE